MKHPHTRRDLIPTDHVFDTLNRFNADYIDGHGLPQEGDVIHMIVEGDDSRRACQCGRPHPGDMTVVIGPRIPCDTLGAVAHMCAMYPWQPAQPN